jgi:hypothetical protein
MFDAEKRSRFRELQLRQDAGLISAEEQVELAKLDGEIQNDEVSYLTRASDRLRTDSEVIERQNRSLEELVRRKEALVERLCSFLDEARRERQAIDSELAEVLADGRNGHTEE